MPLSLVSGSRGWPALFMRVSEGVVEGAFGWARGKAGGRLTAILRAGVPKGPAPGAGEEGERAGALAGVFFVRDWLGEAVQPGPACARLSASDGDGTPLTALWDCLQLPATPRAHYLPTSWAQRRPNFSVRACGSTPWCSQQLELRRWEPKDPPMQTPPWTHSHTLPTMSRQP